MASLAGLHPYPTGWYAIAFSSELTAGDVKTVHYFGRDIVLYRTESGEAIAIDPFCPHLGAHLGHGGKLEGDSIRCPFHGWRYAPTGEVDEIVGCDKLPKNVRLNRWPIREQDDVICVFQDVDVHEGLRDSPREPFPFEPLGGDGHTPCRTVEWTLRTHPQEVCENTVDMAHLLPIHGVPGAHVIRKPHIDGSHMNVVIEFIAPGDLIGMPGQDNDVQLDVIVDGLGRIVARTYVKNVDVRARQAIYCTPIDGDKMSLRGVVTMVENEDAEFTASLSELFFTSFVHDFQKDFSIWENKRYVERPVLSAADGPIGVYRRWSRQFYPAANAKPKQQTASAARSQQTNGQGVLDVLQGRLGQVVAKGRALLAMLPNRSPSVPREAPVATAPASAAEPAKKTKAPPSKVELPPPVASVEDYFNTLDARFVAEGSRGVEAVFQWDLSGDEGMKRYAVVSDGTMELHEGEHDNPTVTIAMAAADYVRMVNREIDGTLAFTTGKAKLGGSIPMAMKMRKIFPA